MSGSMNTLAQMFMNPREATEFEREEILQKALTMTSYLVEDKAVFIFTPSGYMILEPRKEDPNIIDIDWHPRDVWERIYFWMNKSSLKWLGDFLRKNKDKRSAK